jgi:hypothetical protein
VNDVSKREMLLVTVPDSRRTHLFQEALARLGQRPARVVSFIDLLAGREVLTDLVEPGTVVRVDSPGKDFETERALLRAGVDVEEGGDYARFSRDEVERLEFDRGKLLCSRQWYLGFCKALDLIGVQLSGVECRLQNSLADIALMFDKPRCQKVLAVAGIPTAKNFGEIGSFAELRECLRRNECTRVFIKLAHGSSGSGVVAYETNGHKHQATTTIEAVSRGNELQLYNSRRIRVYRELREIAPLIDALCRHRVYVEEWLPKAGLGERVFDLRVVVIGTRALHSVVRMNRRPITNLHLLGGRGSLDAVVQRMGDRSWRAARLTCERVLRDCFPHSLYAGIDLHIAPDFRRHNVLEVNAFGDLLPDVFCAGLVTYETELSVMLNGDCALAAGC